MGLTVVNYLPLRNFWEGIAIYDYLLLYSSTKGKNVKDNQRQATTDNDVFAVANYQTTVGGSVRVKYQAAVAPFINAKAQELGIDDASEVVNYLLLQLLEGNRRVTSAQPAPDIKQA